MLRVECRYSSIVVEDVKQVLLTHTDAGIRGDRQITFDQWAQLFEWISNRLDLSTPEKLKRRMGSYIGMNLGDHGRTPLQVLHPLPSTLMVRVAQVHINRHVAAST